MWALSSAVWLLAVCSTRSVGKGATRGTSVGKHFWLKFTLCRQLLYVMYVLTRVTVKKIYIFCAHYNLESIYQWIDFSHFVSACKQITEYWYLVFSCDKRCYCSQYTPAASVSCWVSAILPRLPTCTCPAWIWRLVQPYSTTTLIHGS